MSFLMGLNENFAQVRGQLLLMDPMPPINKVFSLISQEEKQRKIGSQLASNTEMEFAIKSDNSKKFNTSNDNSANSRGPNDRGSNNRPFSTHCNYHRHIVEKCYKIHGYPPRFRQRQKNQSNFNHPNAVVSQVSNQPHLGEQDIVANANDNKFLQTLSADQCQQLLAMLSSHLTSTGRPLDQIDSPSTLYVTSRCFSVFIHPILSYTNYLIVDSGASKHICSHACLFIFLEPIKNATVTLPNCASIFVQFCGDIQLNPHLILTDLLFVPSSSLTRNL